MKRQTFAQWKISIKDLNVFLFRSDTSLTEPQLLEVLHTYGIQNPKLMPLAKIDDAIPAPNSKLGHVYGFIGEDQAGIDRFLRFARTLIEKDPRPYFFLLTSRKPDMDELTHTFVGHLITSEGKTAYDFETGFIDTAHKVLLQEQADYWYQQWNNIKQLSDELNAEAFQFQQEQNEIIRLAKSLGEKLNPKDVSKTVCQAISDVFKLDIVGFMKYDEMADTLRLDHVEGKLENPPSLRGLEVNVKGKRDPMTYFENFCHNDDIINKLKKTFVNMEVMTYPTTVKEDIVGMFFLANQKSLKSIKTHLLDQLVQAFSISYQNAILHEKISNLAIRDGLTGLHNVRYFHERLTAEFNRMERLKHPLGLIFLDIDKFKIYNDTHGHPNGDKVIKQVAELIVKVFRPTDLIARYGGEEFVIAMPHASSEDAYKRAEELRKSVEKTKFPFEESQPLGKITISLGVSAFPEIANDAKSLLKSADDCLYEVKEGGRNATQAAKVPDGHVPLFVPRK